ncbi:hypothetical protein Q8G47_28940, partial [Klebsiella pneumoniae]|uniref:hypothetical protein n=1 Tax=Klebsiella pneumoniae TaxID=573 RepID=UPI0030137BE5
MVTSLVVVTSLTAGHRRSRDDSAPGRTSSVSSNHREARHAQQLPSPVGRPGLWRRPGPDPGRLL